MTLQRQSQESRGWLRVLQSGELGVQGHSTLRPVLGLSVTCPEAPVSQKKSHPAGDQPLLCRVPVTPSRTGSDPVELGCRSGWATGCPWDPIAGDSPHAVFCQVFQRSPEGVHILVHTQVPVRVMGRVKVGHNPCCDSQAPED